LLVFPLLLASRPFLKSLLLLLFTASFH
jgi:hypothetical protein